MTVYVNVLRLIHRCHAAPPFAVLCRGLEKNGMVGARQGCGMGMAWHV